MAGARKKVKAEDENQVKDEAVQLERIYYIHYPICFQKNSADIKALLDLGSKVNTMTPAIASKLGLRTRYIDVGA